jgi:hypothetical protein
MMNRYPYLDLHDHQRKLTFPLHYELSTSLNDHIDGVIILAIFLDC